MFRGRKHIFAGKQRLHGEPFCPFVTNETGYQELFRRRNTGLGISPLQNTGSLNPINPSHPQARPKPRG